MERSDCHRYALRYGIAATRSGRTFSHVPYSSHAGERLGRRRGWLVGGKYRYKLSQGLGGPISGSVRGSSGRDGGGEPGWGNCPIECPGGETIRISAR